MAENVREHGLFVRNTQLSSFAKGETTAVIKQIFGEPDLNKRYSRIGYEEDLLYVCEPGKFIKDGNAYIYIRADKTAVKSENHTLKEISSASFDESIGESVLSEAMPKWAARYWFQIKWMSYPIRIQSLSNTQIEALGVRIDNIDGKMCYAHCGDEKFQFVAGKNNLQEVMKLLWNTNFGSFKKTGTDLIAYRYDDEKFDMPSERISKIKGYRHIVETNPYITFYQLEPK